MVTTLFTYIIGLFISMLTFIMPEWQLWPSIVFEAFEYFVDSLMSLNSLFIVIPTILAAFAFFLRFMFWFGVFLISRKVFNYLRGAQGL